MIGPESTLGERVSEYRSRLGMSQKELAGEVGRSESWVSQVERDVLAVERLPVLQSLADALGVGVSDLKPKSEAGSPKPEQPKSDLDALRSILTGHPAPDLILTVPAAAEADVATFKARVADAWELTHASSFRQLNTALIDLIPDLERAWRTGEPEQRAELAELLSSAYQATAAAFARLDEADASWLAADRSLQIAGQGDDPYRQIAGLFRMVHAFITLRRLDQAQDAAQNGLAALKSTIDAAAEPQPEALSLYGAMHLTLAVVHAKAGRRQLARDAIAEARAIAERLGDDRNDYNTEFGPTNVQLHAVAVAADLGDAGEALEVAGEVDASRLSFERQSRFYIDVARAHAQRRHVGEAVNALLEAERAAPEQVQTHVLVRELIREMLTISGRRASEELQALARRCAVT